MGFSIGHDQSKPCWSFQSLKHADSPRRCGGTEAPPILRRRSRLALLDWCHAKTRRCEESISRVWPLPCLRFSFANEWKSLCFASSFLRVQLKRAAFIGESVYRTRTRLCVSVVQLLSDDVVDHFPVDVRQAEIAAGIAVSQLLVIDARAGAGSWRAGRGRGPGSRRRSSPIRRMRRRPFRL